MCKWRMPRHVGVAGAPSLPGAQTPVRPSLPAPLSEATVAATLTIT